MKKSENEFLLKCGENSFYVKCAYHRENTLVKMTVVNKMITRTYNFKKNYFKQTNQNKKLPLAYYIGNSVYMGIIIVLNSPQNFITSSIFIYF